MAERSTPFPVLVHPFLSPTPGTCAYELVPSLPPPSPSIQAQEQQPRNALVFIGGLGDGPHTVPFIRTIAERLAQSREGQRSLSYSVFEVRLATSFAGWGFGNLASDVRDLRALVSYLRGDLRREKVVLMGHSTGSQDCVEYANYIKHDVLPVQGFILQGPVSDREGITDLVPEGELDRLNASLAQAATMIAEGKGSEIMPQEKLPPDWTTPVTAYRWYSLAAKGGDDDFFSSDLSDEDIGGIWSRFRAPVLVLPSENDQHVPKSVDFAGLLERWRRLAPLGIVSPLSGFIPGADHSVSQSSARDWTARTVVKFLETLEAA